MAGQLACTYTPWVYRFDARPVKGRSRSLLCRSPEVTIIVSRPASNPKASIGLLKGENLGKQLVKLT